MTNKEIGDLCNKAFGVEWDESAHRKKTKNYLEGYNDAKTELGNANQQVQNIIEEDRILKHETDKTLKKIQTEKLEYSRWLREEARDELITEKICDTIRSLSPLHKPKYIQPIDTKSYRSYVLAFGDEHYGIEFCLKGLFDDILNEYSPEIFEHRMWDLFEQVVDIVHKENIETLNIFSMGDFSDGIIRTSQLMKLRYGVVDGTIKYADFISTWLNELSEHVRIKFQMTDGNHTELRMLGAPKGTFTEDNMGKVVSEFIKVRLENNPNFTYIQNPTGYIYAQLSGYTILGFHGETKDMKKAIDNFSRAYNVPIDFLIGGHFHHSYTEDVGINNEVISIPSILGAEPYSLSKLKVSSPGAKLIIFEPLKGDVCEYKIKLN